MKIIRYQDSQNRIAHGWQGADGAYRQISGDVFGAWSATVERADVARLLAPVAPAGILCIGLNYRRHAVETHAKIPERPILFFKGNNAVQNPGDPILIPRSWPAMRSITNANSPSSSGEPAKMSAAPRRSIMCSATPAPTT